MTADARLELEQRRMVAALAGGLLLAGPRRTRPLAGFLYGVALSRVHGAARDRLFTETVERMGELFAQRTSVGARVDRLEAILRSQYGGKSLEAIEAGVQADAPAPVRLPVWTRGAR